MDQLYVSGPGRREKASLKKIKEVLKMMLNADGGNKASESSRRTMKLIN
jgi:hypothetical protein